MPVTMATALTAQCWPMKRCRMIWNTSLPSCASRSASSSATAWEGKRPWRPPWRRLAAEKCHQELIAMLQCWPFSLFTPVLSKLNFVRPSVRSVSLSLSVFVVWFSGEVGGSGHQSSPDIHAHQLPVLHPGHAGGEDLQWHPTIHRQTDGWGSAAQIGQGQDSFLNMNMSAVLLLIKPGMLVCQECVVSCPVVLLYLV